MALGLQRQLASKNLFPGEVLKLCQGSTNHFAHLFANVLSHKQKVWLFEKLLTEINQNLDFSQSQYAWALFSDANSSFEESWNGIKLDEILRIRMHVLTFAWLHTKQFKFSQQKGQ